MKCGSKTAYFAFMNDPLYQVSYSPAQFGVGPDSYEHVLEIMQGMQGAFDQNPVPLKTEDAGILLKPFFK